ncbi:hypothetical protein HYX16_01975 [Candidatus Woesearchaeota archaeon]|nr:hypothetical protein [Candidatus Woesearchaeota archaeon]
MTKNKVSGLKGLLTGLVFSFAVTTGIYSAEKVARLLNTYKETASHNKTFLFFRNEKAGFKTLDDLAEQLKEAQVNASLILYDLNTIKYMKYGLLPFNESIDQKPVESKNNPKREKINEKLFSSDYEDNVKRFNDAISCSQLMWGPFGIKLLKFDNKDDLEKILTAQDNLERQLDQQFLEIDIIKDRYDNVHKRLEKSYRASFLASFLVAVESGLFGLYLLKRKKE